MRVRRVDALREGREDTLEIWDGRYTERRAGTSPYLGGGVQQVHLHPPDEFRARVHFSRPVSRRVQQVQV